MSKRCDNQAGKGRWRRRKGETRDADDVAPGEKNTPTEKAGEDDTKAGMKLGRRGGMIAGARVSLRCCAGNKQIQAGKQNTGLEIAKVPVRAGIAGRDYKRFRPANRHLHRTLCGGSVGTDGGRDPVAESKRKEEGQGGGGAEILAQGDHFIKMLGSPQEGGAG